MAFSVDEVGQRAGLAGWSLGAVPHNGFVRGLRIAQMRPGGVFSRRSTRHLGHVPQGQRHAHEVPLRLRPTQPSHAELPDSQGVVDPTAERLGDPLALAVGRLNFFGLEVSRYRCGVWLSVGGDLEVALALSAERHDDFNQQLFSGYLH